MTTFNDIATAYSTKADYYNELKGNPLTLQSLNAYAILLTTYLTRVEPSEEVRVWSLEDSGLCRYARSLEQDHKVNPYILWDAMTKAGVRACVEWEATGGYWGNYEGRTEARLNMARALLIELEGIILAGDQS